MYFIRFNNEWLFGTIFISSTHLLIVLFDFIVLNSDCWINIFILKFVDECANNTKNNCDENATCTDTDRSFTCACNEGWTGDGVNCTGIHT